MINLFAYPIILIAPLAQPCYEHFIEVPWPQTLWAISRLPEARLFRFLFTLKINAVLLCRFRVIGTIWQVIDYRILLPMILPNGWPIGTDGDCSGC